VPARDLIEVSNLCKSYGGVRALDDVSLSFASGEIHALCGENGAGKSTLIKCLSGVTRPDSGSITINGNSFPSGSVAAAEESGIAAIHQESTAFPDLDTASNIFVGREPRRWPGWFLDRRTMRLETRRLLQELGQDFNPQTPVGELPFANRQMVAMARALSQRCRLLIMDEPTASLSARETDTLLAIVRRLRDAGTTVLYVSHRLEEIFELADRVSVLRDGAFVCTRDIGEINKDELIRLMVGRAGPELAHRHPHPGKPGEIRLSVDRLCSRAKFQDISFSIRSGEIVGLAGLVGAGRSEVARAIFGVDCYDSGTVQIDGVRLGKCDVPAAMRLGLGLVPEDRQHEGLLLPMTVRENVSLAVLRQLTRFGLVQRRLETALVQRLLDRLQVKAASEESAAETLSGGNQQKLVLGKWLALNPRVLILDEPTRGIDVGAKAQVHQMIRQLAADGMATLLISSELPELLSICDRILVMRGGRLSGELAGDVATQAALLQLALPDEQTTVSTV
jgi:ribose transport system ATP-binding protein